MKLYVTVKQAGKNKAKIVNREINISKNPKILKDLICEVVKSEVENYNNKVYEDDIFKYLTSEEIQDKSSTGKISFGERHNENDQNVKDAINNALVSFGDGIYRVIVNGEEVEALEESLDLSDEDSLTFIKLTMLSGRLW